ncbi:MAG TPA: tyrosine-type recombinase/integrase [Solirubrobacteraceae bacterium]|nr:tyrosine-type recombinase/integrase [Solirubrobacteraceae bacterium]
MSPLHDALSDYLALRRALGFKLARTEKLLCQFLVYLHEHGQAKVTTDRALAWAALAAGGDAWRALRLGVVRGFASYLHSIDPAHEVPPAGLLPCPPHRATPYFYAEEEIATLMSATVTLRTSHCVATYRTLIGLLAVTGMRISEASGLDREDFDAAQATLLIRGAKFGKSRQLPVHESTAQALVRYLRRTDRPRSAVSTKAVFVSGRGARLQPHTAQGTFRELVRRAGITRRSAACHPRLHDLRHTFAVKTILDAYRTGTDAGPRLAVLCTYMGHVDPANTYWYLHAAPELMALAGERLERHLQQGGQR